MAGLCFCNLICKQILIVGNAGQRLEMSKSKLWQRFRMDFVDEKNTYPCFNLADTVLFLLPGIFVSGDGWFRPGKSFWLFLPSHFLPWPLFVCDGKMKKPDWKRLRKTGKKVICLGKSIRRWLGNSGVNQRRTCTRQKPLWPELVPHFVVAWPVGDIALAVHGEAARQSPFRIA